VIDLERLEGATIDEARVEDDPEGFPRLVLLTSAGVFDITPWASAPIEATESPDFAIGLGIEERN
jgi:hypothetical protein